jgi:hypothetical protein
MAVFLIELYVAEADDEAVKRSAPSVLHAADQMTLEGIPVRYLRSIFIPEDETCFFMFEAAAIEAVRGVARRAGVQFERITKAVVDPNDAHPHR